MLAATTAVSKSTFEKLNELSPRVTTWAEQLDELRDMWMAAVPTEEIAERLGRSPSAVLTQAARLELPRRAPSGRKARTSGEIKKSRAGITPTNVITFPLRAETARTPSARKTRDCLMCHTSFNSHGSHNRICPRCKTGAAYQGGHEDGYAVRIA